MRVLAALSEKVSSRDVPSRNASLSSAVSFFLCRAEVEQRDKKVLTLSDCLILSLPTQHLSHRPKARRHPDWPAHSIVSYRPPIKEDCTK